MKIWHLTLATEGRLPLIEGEAAYRAAVMTLARTLGPLLLFCIVDEHLHTVFRCSEQRRPKLRSGVTRAVQALAINPVASSFIRRVERRSHLDWLVRYVVTQVQHHNLSHHPALWTGSCFLDLIGARVVEGLVLPIFSCLPRLGPEDVCAMVGLPRRKLDLAPNQVIREVGVARLAQAAAAARCADPALVGKHAEVVSARQITAQLARAAGIASTEVSWALGVSARSARRLAAARCDDRLLAATRRRLTLELMVSDGQGTSRRPSQRIAGVRVAKS